MLRNKKEFGDKLEDTEVTGETPGEIESPTDESAKKDLKDFEANAPKEGQTLKEACDPCEKVSSEFMSCVILSSELIESKSTQEIITVLDNQLRAIREAAIKRLIELKS